MSATKRPAGANRQYWLVKSEPGTFSFDNLWDSPGRTTGWDGVRNYQARNLMRDEMQKGDLVFFYHSSTAEPGIVGIAEVVSAAYPDETAHDPDNPHFDPRSKPENPSWHAIDIRAVEKFSRPVTLSELRTRPELEGLPLLQKGSRLSVQRVGAVEWNAVLVMAKGKNI